MTRTMAALEAGSGGRRESRQARPRYFGTTTAGERLGERRAWGIKSQTKEEASEDGGGGGKRERAMCIYFRRSPQIYN